jgi:hypothetical protein
MNLYPYLAGAGVGLVAYLGLYFLFDRRMIAELSKPPATPLTDEERRRRATMLPIVKVLLRVVTPLALIGYFAYCGPVMFGDA